MFVSSPPISLPPPPPSEALPSLSRILALFSLPLLRGLPLIRFDFVGGGASAALVLSVRVIRSLQHFEPPSHRSIRTIDNRPVLQ
jgi:hypothetical protein